MIMMEKLKYKIGDIVYIEGYNNLQEIPVKGVYKIIHTINNVNAKYPYSCTKNLKHEPLTKRDRRFVFFNDSEIKFLYKNKSQLFAYKV